MGRERERERYELIGCSVVEGSVCVDGGGWKWRAATIEDI